MTRLERQRVLDQDIRSTAQDVCTDTLRVIEEVARVRTKVQRTLAQSKHLRGCAGLSGLPAE